MTEVVAGLEDRMVRPGMTFGGGDVADRAVPMHVIVPIDEARCPVAGGVAIGEAPLRKFGAILRRSEQ
jgi:hypothetical protein